MPRGKSSFARRTGSRPYRKLFLIVTEGTKTEPDYFRMVRQLVIQEATSSEINVQCTGGLDGSDPKNLLGRMEEQLQIKNLKPSDEAWIVMDRDNWLPKDLNKVMAWAKPQPNYRVAFSNPSFEYWLLLHFEDGNGVGNQRECEKRLKICWPDYNKRVPINKFDLRTVKKAIERAKQRNQPPSKGWSGRPGVTTVYVLVERMLDA